jgi:hypothetical protein
MPVEPMTQTAFPFLCDKAALRKFLIGWLALEDEEDKLRAQKLDLKAWTPASRISLSNGVG